jgi:hypothetical protein
MCIQGKGREALEGLYFHETPAESHGTRADASTAS